MADGSLFFTVYGDPQPQGSARAFIPRGWKRPIITSANPKLKPWRQEVAKVSRLAMEQAGLRMFERHVPVQLQATFYFHRPMSTRKTAHDKVTKPDTDKLLRGLLDSLTGIVYRDDSQVSRCAVLKLFGSPSRVEVHITPILHEAAGKSEREMEVTPLFG